MGNKQGSDGSMLDEHGNVISPSAEASKSDKRSDKASSTKAGSTSPRASKQPSDSVSASTKASPDSSVVRPQSATPSAKPTATPTQSTTPVKADPTPTKPAEAALPPVPAASKAIPSSAPPVATRNASTTSTTSANTSSVNTVSSESAKPSGSQQNLSGTPSESPTPSQTLKSPEAAKPRVSTMNAIRMMNQAKREAESVPTTTTNSAASSTNPSRSSSVRAPSLTKPPDNSAAGVSFNDILSRIDNEFLTKKTPTSPPPKSPRKPASAATADGLRQQDLEALSGAGSEQSGIIWEKFLGKKMSEVVARPSVAESVATADTEQGRKVLFAAGTNAGSPTPDAGQETNEGTPKKHARRLSRGSDDDKKGEVVIIRKEDDAMSSNSDTNSQAKSDWDDPELQEKILEKVKGKLKRLPSDHSLQGVDVTRQHSKRHLLVMEQPSETNADNKKLVVVDIMEETVSPAMPSSPVAATNEKGGQTSSAAKPAPGEWMTIVSSSQAKKEKEETEEERLEKQRKFDALRQRLMKNSQKEAADKKAEADKPEAKGAPKFNKRPSAMSNAQLSDDDDDDSPPPVRRPSSVSAVRSPRSPHTGPDSGKRSSLLKPIGIVPPSPHDSAFAFKPKPLNIAADSDEPHQETVYSFGSSARAAASPGASLEPLEPSSAKEHSISVTGKSPSRSPQSELIGGTTPNAKNIPKLPISADEASKAKAARVAALLGQAVAKQQPPAAKPSAAKSESASRTRGRKDGGTSDNESVSSRASARGSVNTRANLTAAALAAQSFGSVRARSSSRDSVGSRNSAMGPRAPARRTPGSGYSSQDEETMSVTSTQSAQLPFSSMKSKAPRPVHSIAKPVAKPSSAASERGGMGARPPSTSKRASDSYAALSTKSSSAAPSRAAARMSATSAKQAPSLVKSARSDSGREAPKNDGSMTPTETSSEVSFSSLGVDAKAMQLQTQLRILELMKKKHNRRDDSSVDGEDFGSRNLDDNPISKLNNIGSEVPEIKDHLKDELDDWASDTAEDNRQSKFRVTSAAAFLNKKKHLYHKSFVDKQFAALIRDEAATSDYASDNDAGSVKDEGGYFSDSAAMSGLSRQRIVPNVVTKTDLNPAAYDVQFRPAQEIVDEIERSERVRGHFSVPLAPFDDDDDEVVLTTVQTKPRSSASKKSSSSKPSSTPLRATPQAASKSKSSASKASPAAPAPKSPAQPENEADAEYDDDDDEGSVIVLSAKALLEKQKAKYQQSRPKTPRSARKPKPNVNPNLPDESF